MLVFLTSAEAAGADGAIRVPEIVVRDARYCVVRADFDDNDPGKRKERLIEFIGDSYDSTDGWKNDFLISAVDYVEFSYLHIVVKRVCEDSWETIATIKDKLGCVNKTGCTPLQVLFSLRLNSPLGHRFTPEIDQNPVRVFEYFRPTDTLASCTISVPFHVPTNAEQYRNVIDHLQLPQNKYRMSLLDVFHINDTLFLLFTRQCDQKAVLYKLYLSLMHQEGFKVGDYLGTPTFEPDVSLYRWTQTGEK